MGVPVLAEDSPPAELIEPPASKPVANVRPEVKLPPADPVMGGESRPAPKGLFGKWRQRWGPITRDKFWGHPEEFIDAPLGASVEAHISVQVANGHAARMVLYQYDFFPVSDQLKPRGRTELARICKCLSCELAPVFIEPTPCRPDLDEARRIAVLQEVSAFYSPENPFPPDLIVIGCPGPRGLMGAEALLIELNLIRQTASRGARGGGGGAPNAGSGATIITEQ